jgi:hypothetical protein
MTKALELRKLSDIELLKELEMRLQEGRLGFIFDGSSYSRIQCIYTKNLTISNRGYYSVDLQRINYEVNIPQFTLDGKPF